MKASILNFRLLRLNVQSSLVSLLLPLPLSASTGNLCTINKPCGGSSDFVSDPVGDGESVECVCGKGAISITPSWRSSIQRVKPVVRGWSEVGRVVSMVRWVVERRPRRVWRKERRL